MKGLWSFALSYFSVVLEDKGEKPRGDYVNFCFGYVVSENNIIYIVYIIIILLYYYNVY